MLPLLFINPLLALFVNIENSRQPLNDDGAVNIVSRSCINSQFQYSASDLDLIQYDISLRPLFNENSFTYRSNVILELTITRQFDHLVIHADTDHYKIQRLTVDIDNNPTKVKHLKECTDFNELIITFARNYPPNSRIRLNFWIENYPNYLSAGLSHKSVTGEKEQISERMVLTSEPKKFRTVFPGVDEPNFKGRFQLRVIRENGWSSYSNMILDSSTPVKLLNDSEESTTMCDEFARGLTNEFSVTESSVCDQFPLTDYAMPPYLFTFIVSTNELIVTKSQSKRSKIDVLLYHDPNFPEYMVRSFLSCTANAIDYFEEYLNVSYPGQYVQNIATEMNAGAALETWNMIIYNEHYGLIKSIIAHEIAHHWFGNLVSISNWKYLWLKEGVTTLLQEHFNYHNNDNNNVVIGGDEFIKKMRQHKKYYFNKIDIVESCNKPTQILETLRGEFDYTYRHYNRPSIVLNMVQYVILESPQLMRESLARVVHRFTNQSINETMFWSCFEQPPDLPDTLENIMSPWFTSHYVPIVKINSNGGDSIYSFSQETFCRLCSREEYVDNNKPPPVAFPYVKVLVKSNKMTNTTSVWIPQNRTVTLDLNTMLDEEDKDDDDDDNWITVDPDNLAYYWIHYEEKLMIDLIRRNVRPTTSHCLSSYPKTVNDFLWSSLHGLYDNADSVMEMFHFALKYGCSDNTNDDSIINNDDALMLFIQTFNIDESFISKLANYLLKRSNSTANLYQLKLKNYFINPYNKHPNWQTRAKIKLDVLFRCDYLPGISDWIDYLLDVLSLRSKYLLYKVFDCIFDNDNRELSNRKMDMSILFDNAYINFQLAEYFAMKLKSSSSSSSDYYLSPLATHFNKFSSKNWCTVVEKLAKKRKSNDDYSYYSCDEKRILEVAGIVCFRQKKYLPGLLKLIQ